MDPNQRRRPEDQPPTQLSPPAYPTGPRASTGNLAAPAAGPSGSAAPQVERNVSPSPSRRSLQPSTPVVEGESNTEYFPSLEPSAPSLTTQPSNLSLPYGRPHSTSNVSSQNRARSPSAQSAASGSHDGTAPVLTRQPSIRIRRRSSSQRSTSSWRSRSNRRSQNRSEAEGGGFTEGEPSGSGQRPRSLSQPEQAYVPHDAGVGRRRSKKRTQPPTAMPRLTEEGSRPTMEELNIDAGGRPPSPQSGLEDGINLERNQTEPGPSDGPPKLSRMRTASRFFWPRRGDHESEPETRTDDEIRRQDEYDERLVDYLDTVDPEVQTLSTLTNVQNSLFVPNLGQWLNRRPTYTLSDHDIKRMPPIRPPPPPPSAGGQRMGDITEHRGEEEKGDAEPGTGTLRPGMERTSTITSRLTDSHYAALPHGATLEGWSREEKEELDDHVRHMMHSRRSKFKRTMKGFGQYVRRPLGFLVTLYATLITLFGLAWVLFLIGWIYVGDSERQVYVIHIIDSVLVALFAVMGDGLAPFRAVDTYHMIFIIRYARIVKNQGKRAPSRLLKPAPPSIRESVDLARALQNSVEPEEPLRRPEEADGAELESQPSNDPHTMRNNIVDVDDAKSGIEAYEDTPLTYKQQQKLHHHQTKLAKSHTYYKPHETGTHYAFPLGYLIAIIILCDCHSLLQISLGACTWGIDYKTRPFALTTVILCVSITVNITSGIVIAVGDRKTRKKDVWQLMTRQELTGDAMRIVEEKRENSNRDENSPQPGLSMASSSDPSETGTKYLRKAPSPESNEQEEDEAGIVPGSRKLSKRSS